MSDSIPINGGEADWTPAERKIWAASKGLPPNMLLVSNTEMMAMHNSMVQQREHTAAVNLQFRHCVSMLQEYWKLEPDIVNAVGHAVFDAQRFKKAVELLAPKIQKIKDRFDAAIKLAGNTVAPVVFGDLVQASADLDREFVDLVAVIARRRERTKVKK